VKPLEGTTQALHGCQPLAEPNLVRGGREKVNNDSKEKERKEEKRTTSNRQRSTQGGCCRCGRSCGRERPVSSEEREGERKRGETHSKPSRPVEPQVCEAEGIRVSSQPPVVQV
jgi:hypothetical protein